MASKRMFSIKIMDSDAFLELPQSAQALYIHLNMRADDDGFIGNAKRITAYVGASVKDLQVLVDARFLLKVDNVHVIKHWRMHNTLYKDRYVPTTYQDEYRKLTIKDNKSYTDCIQRAKQNDNKNDIAVVNKSGSKSVNNCVTNHDNTDIDIDIDKDLNNISCAAKPHETDSLEDFYESIWELYPVKKGKGQVSKTKKQVLQRLGYEQMQRCVERFVADMESDSRDKKYWMHGSTFFNGGYVDYLDCNYSVTDNNDSNKKVSGNNSDSDRFSVLEKDFREEMEFLGIIDGQSLDLGNASDEQIERLQKAGVL